MSSRIVGLAAGVAVGVVVALLPIADWWELFNGFTPIPGGVAAGVGAVVAGYLLGPQINRRRQALGLVAVGFAGVMFLAALPLVVLDAAILGARPLDEDWPVTSGPLLGAVIGTAIRAPLLLAVASIAAALWTGLVLLTHGLGSRRRLSSDVSRP